MLKNMGFIILTGAVMAVVFSPIYIEAKTTAPAVKKEIYKKDSKEKKKGKGGCPCGK